MIKVVFEKHAIPARKGYKRSVESILCQKRSVFLFADDKIEVLPSTILTTYPI